MKNVKNHYLTSLYWCPRKMEAADFSIMGRHKHYALTAISITIQRGEECKPYRLYIFDLSTAIRLGLWDKHILWKRLVSSAIGSWSWGLLRKRSKRCSELVLVDIRIMNAQWKNSISPKLRQDLGPTCLKTSTKKFYMAVYMLMNLSWLIYNELSPRVEKADNSLYGTNIEPGYEFVYGRMCMETNL